ncbi:hypothetical protein OIU77_003889, partial [Salix suchowensis]
MFKSPIPALLLLLAQKVIHLSN